ncbi:CD209 antigen-like protein E isoform X2 [Marmota monax]|uniref:CD209 antigen-like protein E isoform X2 n=1 Tax=Marmota monax TaxID=9995 RepID=UPI001EB011A9|nr:CD209 antigen-like protein E isoform X2 [Marmota monax]
MIPGCWASRVRLDLPGCCRGGRASEEKATFGGQRFTEKDPEMLTQSPKSFPGPAGWLTRVPWILLLLLSSLGLCFVLLVTTLVQVSRTPGSPQAKVQDHQNNFSLGAASQEQVLSGLEQVRQQLTWINTSLAALCRPCPWGWEAFQGNCYLFSRTLGSWENAVSSCRDMGAHLVIINNAAEQRFLRYWDIRKSQRTWIGLSDHNNEGSWYWVDNTPLQLSYWKEGEPNNAGDEDCVELFVEDWNDSKCTAQNFWICERPSARCPGA